jgi:hypothetical protein
MIQKQLCEALYAAGRRKEAGESLLRMVSTVDEEVCVSGPIAAWKSGELCSTCSSAIHLKFHAEFAQRCLFTGARERSGDPASEGHDDVLFHPLSPTPLLKEWAKLKLASGSWKDALNSAASVSILSLCYPSWA